MAIKQFIIDKLFKHEIYFEPFVSVSSGGKHTYGAMQGPFRCHIRDEVKIWKWEDGTEKQSKRGVYVVNTDIGRFDRVTLPAGYDPRVGTVLWSIKRSDHQDPYHHTEFFL